MEAKKNNFYSDFLIEFLYFQVEATSINEFTQSLPSLNLRNMMPAGRILRSTHAEAYWTSLVQKVSWKFVFWKVLRFCSLFFAVKWELTSKKIALKLIRTKLLSATRRKINSRSPSSVRIFKWRKIEFNFFLVEKIFNLSWNIIYADLDPKTKNQKWF